MAMRRLPLLCGLAVMAALALSPTGAVSKPKPTTTTTAATTTTLPATTTTASPTTTTMAATTTTTQPTSQLRWPAPADYLAYPVFHVGGTANVVNAGSGDARVVCDSPLSKRLILNGGRNLVVRGCEINITSTALSDDDRNCVWVTGNNTQQLIHLEGVWCHGAAAPAGQYTIDDGITGSAANAVWRIQRSRLEIVTGDANDHSDCFQPWAGFAELDIDMVSCVARYQGLMLKGEDPSTVAGATQWRTTILGRLDLRHVAGAETLSGVGWLLNFVNGTRPDGHHWMTGPIDFGGEVYLLPRNYNGTSSILRNDMGMATGNSTEFPKWWTVAGDTNAPGDGTATPNASNPDGVTITGQVREGAPPGGPYQPAGGCGGCPGQAYGG